MSKFSKIITITMLALFVCLQAGYSQVTTSSMSGSVSEKGETLIGATIVATHEPTGTVYGTVTNTNGRYAIQGMRTGGPYKVVIQYIGYNSHTQDNVFLQLGETYVLDALLSESTTALGEVVISAERTKFTTEKTGATTNVNNEQMQKLPTINRSIQDITRLSPYANGMSFAGSDGRSSNLTIDGANLNNNFGLSSALPGGGNPISLDAIEEVQVVIAPFDVRQTNFIGGGVNAITKSGTNTFKGSAYVYYRNQDMRGGKIGDYDFEKESGKPRAKESRTVYGATFGGPIIKNKLFFFGNIEYEKSPQQVITYRASTDGTAVAGAISRTKESDLQAVSDHLKNKYGYNTGSYKDFPADATNLKYLLRLDWNINDANKFNIRYNYTKNTAWNPPNGNSADAGYRFTFNRVSEMSMSYANSMYSMDNLVNSATAELNSRFNANMSNQLLATYSLIKDVRGSTSDPFPFIDIMNGYDASTGIQNLTPYIAAGYELFTWNNGVTNKVATVTDNFTYYLNSHKFTAGISYEYQYADNNYMRNGTGYYRYASLEDFLNSAAPTDFALTFGNNGNTNPSNAVAFGQLGVYVQDEWNILNNLKITAGVRGDNLMFLNDIMRNNAIYNLDFGGRKIDTGTWPKSRINWSPRLGFTYDALKDKSLVIRGGIGIFTGRLPLVFFTNMPSNAGMIQQLQTIRTTYRPDGTVNVRDPRLDLLAGDIITDVNEMINRLGFNTTVTPESGTIPSEIAAVDPDFKMPQVWKSSFAVDYQIPVNFPFTATVEGMYTKNINAVMLDNYNYRTPESGNWDRFSGSDNRLIYPSTFRYYTNFTNSTVLTNTNEGYGYTFNITLNAQPVKNLNLMAAYTRTEMKEVSGMPGSNATSAWVNLYTVDGPNLSKVQRSQYVTPDQVIGSMSYQIPYLKNHMGSTISLFYRGFSPYGNSYAYSNDMNGDGISNDLMYIPKEPDDIKFRDITKTEDGTVTVVNTAKDQSDAFFAFMEQDSYLKKNKGNYAEAYAARPPFVHKFDLRFLQDFSVKVGQTRNTLQLSVDILNVGNLLKSTWGVNQSNTASGSGQILRYAGRDANNAPTYTLNKVNVTQTYAGDFPTKTYSNLLNYNQCWSLQIGLRYIFN